LVRRRDARSEYDLFYPSRELTVNKGFLKLVSLSLVGVLLSVSGYAQNYRVKAERYERGIYSPETNPASVRYAIIDLGPDIEPIRLSNSGHVLCQPAKRGKLQSRWYQGQLQELTGGDDLLVGTLDMNDAGTVVGAILEYKTGSVRGIPPCPDSEYAWYRNPSYGIRRAAAWYAGSGGASLLDHPKYPFNIYDCTVPHGPPYTGTATFGSAWTIDDSGHIYGEAQVAYAEHQQYNPAPDDYYSPTVPAAAYSGYSFGGAGILGDLSLVYDPDHNIYTTQGTSYHVRKVRNGVTMGYDSTGKNLVNSLPVDFVPTTMNSQGLVLGAVVVDPNSFLGGYTKFLIYDPATRIQTDLPMRASRFFGPGQFHPPVALNHRTIAVTNSSGQTTFKESPQIVGPSGAVIWEEDPKTGQYFYQSLNLLIPENSGWTLTMAKAVNDSGTILCKGIFQGQTRACLLLRSQPFELKQLNYPTSTDTSDLGPAETKVIPAGGTAYITGTPEMPRLEAQAPIEGLAATGVEWWLEVKSERTERGTKDDFRIPATGTVERRPDEAWRIFEQFVPPAGFFGGRCTLHYRVKGPNGYLGDEQQFTFVIRGKNPTDASSRGYIQATAGAYRFAWAMVQHESRQAERIYNQFNAAGGTKELPNFSGNFPEEDGWGIAQLDRPLGTSATTEEVYGWHQNMTKFYAELNQKQQFTDAYFNALRNFYTPKGTWEEPPATVIREGTTTPMTPAEAAVIQLYNGAAWLVEIQNGVITYDGPYTNTAHGGTRYISCWRFKPAAPSGQKWEFKANQNNYVYKVIYDEFEAHLAAQE